MKAIETRFKGYRFRSRLEARWAVYMDAAGMEWEYEQQGYDLDGVKYLPDFWLPTFRVWAEVKPTRMDEAERDKVSRLVAASGRPCVLLIGTPDACAYPLVEFAEEGRVVVTDCIMECFKGRTNHLYVNTGISVPDDWMPSLPNQDGLCVDNVSSYVSAARAARFEHGERG